MVMATPSPQQVGREFVRQYYTLLHEAPEVLHRFYSSGSTFVHGGIDRPGQHAEEPVTGQLDIDKKIKELSFKDCHTKIRQVDSQATIGSGVVVQVTGELSNNGEPMRRFMQTFVLAPQSAKKFYVHNDIFRYQDEVYHDNSDTESEDHQTIQEAAQQAPAAGTAAASAAASGKPAGYYQQAGADHHHHQQQHQPETNHHHHNSNNHQHHHHEHQETPAVQQQIEVKGEQPNLLVNGHSNNVEQQQQNVAVQELAPQPQRVVKEDGKENKSNNVELFSVPAENHHESVKTNSVVGGKSAATGKEEKESQQDSKSSWAKIIGTNRSTGSSSDANSNNALTSSQNFQGGQSQTTSSASIKFGSYGKDQKIIQKGSASTATQNGSKGSNNKTTKSASSGSSSSNKEATGGVNAQSMNSSNARDQQKEKRGGTQGGDMGNSLDTSLSGNLEDDKRSGRYPDGQQVFVGNLNQDLSETELRSLFGQYGKVVEVRINTNSKQQSGRRLPNYGFVVFDDQKTVDNLLGSTKSNNILYKSEKGVEYRLNVEEKRARQGRVSSGFGGGNSNSGGSGGKSNRATRSSSNGSRNGPNNNNNNNNNTNGTSSSKKNSNNTTNDYINEKKREIHEHNNNHQMIENSGGGNFHKNTSRRS